MATFQALPPELISRIPSSLDDSRDLINFDAAGPRVYHATWVVLSQQLQTAVCMLT